MTASTVSARTASSVMPGRSRRRGPSRRLLIGIVLAVVGALAVVVVYRQADNRVAVVAVARPVPFGQTVTRADLREAQLPVDSGLATVPWSAVDSVVGRTALTDLLVGQSVTPDGVGTTPQPEAGYAVVGIAVGPGRAPVRPFEVRDEVMIVGVADSAAPKRGTVVRVGPADPAGKRTVDLLVPEAVAADLARSSAGEHAALVLVSRR